MPHKSWKGRLREGDHLGDWQALLHGVTTAPRRKRHSGHLAETHSPEECTTLGRIVLLFIRGAPLSRPAPGTWWALSECLLNARVKVVSGEGAEMMRSERDGGVGGENSWPLGLSESLPAWLYVPAVHTVDHDGRVTISSSARPSLASCPLFFHHLSSCHRGPEVAPGTNECLFFSSPIPIVALLQKFTHGMLTLRKL